MNKILFLLIFVFGCSSAKEKSLGQQTLIKGDCVSAFEKEYQTPGLPSKILNATTRVVGTTASYLLTGVGHSTDLVLTFAGGVAIAAVVCSPVIALEAAGKGNGKASTECVARMTTEVTMQQKLTTLGKKTYSATRGWRCPNLDHVSAGLRKVASCYEAQGEQTLALAQLKAIREQQLFVECLSAVEFKTVADELTRISPAKN